jgi:hypothetical protein
MALAARHAREQTRMESRFGVTGCAARREHSEYVVGMTFRTGQPGMRTGQWKLRE